MATLASSPNALVARLSLAASLASCSSGPATEAGLAAPGVFVAENRAIVAG